MVSFFYYVYFLMVGFLSSFFFFVVIYLYSSIVRDTVVDYMGFVSGSKGLKGFGRFFRIFVRERVLFFV